MNQKLWGALAALITAIVLAGCTFSLEPVNALDTDAIVNANTGLIKVTNNSGKPLLAVRIIHPDEAFTEHRYAPALLSAAPDNFKEHRFPAGVTYRVKFQTTDGWTTNAKSGLLVKGQTFEFFFEAADEITPDTVEKGELIVWNKIPGEYIIEEIRVSCGEAGRETAVYQYETEINPGERRLFEEVPAANYYVRARIRKAGGTVVSKWSVPALVGTEDGAGALTAWSSVPGEILVSVGTAGVAVFNEAVLLGDGSVNTPLEEVINLLVVQGEGRITLNWTDPEDTDIDHIEISYISTSLPVGSLPLTQTVKKGKETAVIAGLENGEAYTITVRTVDAGGNSKSAGVQLVVVMGSDTPPAEVTWLTATVSGKRVRLSWTDPADEDFDHVEISYNSDSGFIQPLPPVAKGLQSKIIESLSYGNTYAFTVRTVDSSGNKSQGSVAIASLDKVIDDLDLDRYVTTPMAGAAPNSRSISAAQYNGTVSWRDSNSNPWSGPTFVAGTEYRAWVTLMANPGYTFQGVAGNSFTHSGAIAAGVTNAVNSGTVKITFQKAIQGWYVSHDGNDGRDGSSLANSVATVAAAVEKIRTAYESSTWPGKNTNNPVSAVIIVSGAVPLSAQILISNTFISVPSLPPYTSTTKPLPPIVLRGAGPDNIRIITGPANGRILQISGGARVIMENDLILKGNATGLSSGDGGGVYIGANSFFTMTGGTITSVTVTASNNGYGGAIYAGEGSTFIMKGGIITGNKARRGAGVSIFRAAFTMSGGSIENNVSEVLAGGVFVNNTTVLALLTMSGGTITGNNGGITLEGQQAVFTMNGGTIAGNQGLQYGGAIRVSRGAKVIINNGVISNNTASTSGDGIYVDFDGSSLTMNGGSILGNTAGQSGGGVSVDTINGGAPSFTMAGGTIAENQAGTYGGGVYITAGGVFKKQPLVVNGPSGVIYGYGTDNPGSNFVKGTLGIETTHGHAVYVESGPKKRETTVSPDQHLDSAATAGWAD